MARTKLSTDADRARSVLDGQTVIDEPPVEDLVVSRVVAGFSGCIWSAGPGACFGDI